MNKDTAIKLTTAVEAALKEYPELPQAVNYFWKPNGSMCYFGAVCYGLGFRPDEQDDDWHWVNEQMRTYIIDNIMKDYEDDYTQIVHWNNGDEDNPVPLSFQEISDRIMNELVE